MFSVSQLFVYPVKSLGGINLNEAAIAETGFKYDRYWTLIDDNDKCITQREIPRLSQFQLSMKEDFIVVTYNNQQIEIPKHSSTSGEIACTIWGETVLAVKEKNDYSEWFSDMLTTKVQLVRKSSNAKRPVKNHPTAAINFPDAGQYLILGESSMEYLNQRLDAPLSINRFRPNIVFHGGEPHIEDGWHIVRIGDARFEVTKACGRCKITTINQETAEVGLEPLRTLSTYRRSDGNIWFGQYLKLLSSRSKLLRVGDAIKMEELK